MTEVTTNASSTGRQRTDASRPSRLALYHARAAITERLLEAKETIDSLFSPTDLDRATRSVEAFWREIEALRERVRRRQSVHGEDQEAQEVIAVIDGEGSTGCGDGNTG